MTKDTLYITGAGVSEASGIPTFRGKQGFWTIGSKNYTPQQMATRQMYMSAPDEFLLWYFKRFVSYRDVKPNKVHYWLSNKFLITQNIDGLDARAGNSRFIPIHGRMDKVTILHRQGSTVPLIDAPWDQVLEQCSDTHDLALLKATLLDIFKISSSSKIPESNVSLKPFVLLFDEYYTELYKISKATKWMKTCDHFVFIGTSFSVNITNIALEIAVSRNAPITIVDPSPTLLPYENIKYKKMSAKNFIDQKI